MLWPCVCPSVCHKPVLYQKRLDESSCFSFGTYPTPCHEEISVSPKIRVLYAETLSHTPDLENFSVAASRSRCEPDSSSSSTVELVDDTCTSVDESWLFTTSRSTVTLHYCDLLCGFIVQLVSTVDKLLADAARRAVPRPCVFATVALCTC